VDTRDATAPNSVCFALNLRGIALDACSVSPEVSMLTRSRLVTMLLAATVLAAAPACATGGLYPQRYPAGDRDDRIYYDRGFREGQNAGADDARRGRSYDPARHRAYRDDRRGDDWGDLRAFRSGFEAGYDEAFRRYARGGRDGRPAYPPPGYPRSQDPNYGGNRGRVFSPAAENGYRDGVAAGERAARRGERYDPVREERYREGDHDYNSRYGSRDEYKREYRDAFQRGYDEGYRGYRR